MSHPINKKTLEVVEPRRNSEEAARLEKIAKLWSHLARLRSQSAEHREMVAKIRKEADEFRRLTDRSPSHDPTERRADEQGSAPNER
jgi:hypothetical protein